MDAWHAAELARQLMEQHGLACWEFRFNRRRQSMGLCVYSTKRIELSLPFVRGNDEGLVRDTILHEIAHALAGHRAGHGPVWKARCLQLGAQPQRCGQAAMPMGAWRATCPTCRRTFHRHRRPARQSRYSCSACGAKSGPLTFKHLLSPPLTAAP
jgi:predicted SprT family Zn-dependent metalloprotease